MTKLRTRIAPTPSGYLHVGNVVNALLIWAHARAVGGHITLRIDDLDPQMSGQPFLEDIFRTIDWLGIDVDAGPSSVAEVESEWSQRYRLASYDATLQSLVEQDMVFACLCSRREIAMSNRGGVYGGACCSRKIPLDAHGVSWRLANNHVAELPYPVVRMKSGLPAYLVASVTDDVAMGVTWILRGEDLEPSSRVQRELARRVPALQSFADVAIVHHGLIRDELGEKLSKSRGATDVRHLRESDTGLREILNAVAQIHGCTPVSRVEDLIGLVRY